LTLIKGVDFRKGIEMKNGIFQDHEFTSSMCNGLQSKQVFDRLPERIKPESGNSGLLKNNLDSEHESCKNGTSDNSILLDVQNLYKHNGTSVENSGYFIIPRSVTSDPRYKSARLKYKHVLHIILENAAFTSTTHAIGVDLIQIKVGQFCTSERNLVDICNEGVKFKEDLVDRNIVTRAAHFWARCQYLRQQVIHGKTLLTVLIPEFYNRNKNQSEPESETKVSQNRATKEEYKEGKEEDINKGKEGTFVPSEFATSLLTDFYNSLFSSIPDFPKENARKTKIQYQAADRIGKKANGDMELIRKVIAYAHEPGGFWIGYVHSVKYLDTKFIKLVQQLRNQGKKPMNGQKPQRKFDFDPTPANPKRSISFAEEV